MTAPPQDGVRFAGEGSQNPSLTASGGYSALAPLLIGGYAKERSGSQAGPRITLGRQEKKNPRPVQIHRPMVRGRER